MTTPTPAPMQAGAAMDAMVEMAAPTPEETAKARALVVNWSRRTGLRRVYANCLGQTCINELVPDIARLLAESRLALATPEKNKP